MRIAAAFVVLALVVGQAGAWERDGGSIPESGSKQVQAKAWPVASYISEPGEAKEAFLLRVAVPVLAWTVETGFETCAFVATDGQRWGLKLITLRSQLECVFAYGMAPDGMTTTRETFHSHPLATKGGYLKLTEGTRAAAKALGDASLRRVREVRIENRGEFSEHDYQAGPGYLITNGRLLFQDGRGKRHRRDVGAVDYSPTH